ncbi:MAG: ParB/RepB/Spo0J family partition protein [Bdellovibrio sp.]|nr:ParB/RepB/Spo0J family partition protein [Bdellovibrio sp.]
MAKKLVLGKGIASLIQEVPKAIHANNLLDSNDERPEVVMKEKVESGPLMIPIEAVKANPGQPRKIFKEKELEELAQSIKENGIIQPIIVRKVDTGFELIAGERRLRAAKKAGIEYIPAIVRSATDRERNIIALLENIQRADLNCVEEALAYYQLMNDFQLTQEEVAKRLGKDRSAVSNYLRILKLPRNVIEFLQKDQLSFGHGKILAGIEDREEVIRLASKALAEQWSVRMLEEQSKTKKIDKDASLNEVTHQNMAKYDSIRQAIEQKSGLQIKIKVNKSGAGHIGLVFSNEAELNEIYNFFASRK